MTADNTSDQSTLSVSSSAYDQPSEITNNIISNAAFLSTNNSEDSEGNTSEITVNDTPAIQTTTLDEPISAASIVFPNYNVSATTTGASWATLNNATKPGYAISYNGGANWGTDTNYQFYIGQNGAGTTTGNAIYDTQSRSFAVTANGGVHIGRGNVFLGRSDLTIATPTNVNSKTSASLTMNSGAYLSVTGNLGAINGTTSTGFITTSANANIKVGANYYTNGASAKAALGVSNSIEVGGILGVLNGANMTIGNNVSITAGTLYTGSNNATTTIGADANVHLSTLQLDGVNDKIYFGDRLTLNTSDIVMGPNGSNAHLSITNNANITVSNSFTNTIANGVVQFGADANLHILTGNLSLGGTGVNTGDRSWFHMGDNNTIILDKGCIILTNKNQTFDWGTGGKVTANSLQISGTDQKFSMGTNATATFTGGVILDGTSNSLSLGSANIGPSGLVINGTNQNVIISQGEHISIAGTFSAGGNTNTITFGSNTTTDLNGGMLLNGTTNSVTFEAGTALNIGLSGIIVSGANQNLAINTDNVNIEGGMLFNGNANTITFGSANIGQNGLTVNGTDQIINISQGAHINTAGNIFFGGSGERMTASNNLQLEANIISLGYGNSDPATQQNNYFIVNNNANITLQNGFINTLYNGVVSFGDNLNLSIITGDFNAAGSGYGGNTFWYSIGNDSTITLQNGSFVMANGNQVLNWGINGNLQAIDLHISGTNQQFNMSSGANVNLTGGIILDGTGSISFAENANMTIGSSGITYNASANMAIGVSATVTVNGDINFGANATGAVFTVGDNATLFKANNIIINAAKPTITFGINIDYSVTGWQLNAANNNIKLGAGATGNIGDITFGAGTTGSLFDTGVANHLIFGSATLVNDAILTLNGTVTGASLNLSNAATVNIPAGANVDIGSLVIDGSNGLQQVIINVADGATLNVASLSTTNVASSNIPKIVINGTGHVIIGGQVARAADTLAHEVQFAGDNGIYHYKGNIQDLSGKLTITDFALTDQAIFEVDASYADQSRYVTSVVDGILYINYVDAATGALTEVAHFNYTPATTSQAVPNVLIVPDASSTTGYNIIITKCFLTGTHILTPEGEVTVENLKAGDTVVTLQNGQQVSKQVVWAGHMDVNVNNYEQKDTLYPVRIKAHAFGLNQPCRDLLVTPEHTIYVDGGLIPARMLVNGRSIIVDTSMDRFTVYHIETEEHSILLSENLTTESYLNTDDRHLFNGDAVNLHLTFNENAGHQSWENDAAAPLTVARHQVEPIWQRLDRRATQQGYAPISKPEVTNDPALCLITQKGERLQPVDVKGNTYSFYVPANVSIVAMHSKAALPSEVVGPFLDDRRMLGVLVAQISVFGDGNLNILPADMTGLSGWHSAELNRTDRWTKGLATLPETVSEMSNKVKLIKIELTATSEYLVDTIEFAEKIA